MAAAHKFNSVFRSTTLHGDMNWYQIHNHFTIYHPWLLYSKLQMHTLVHQPTPQVRARIPSITFTNTFALHWHLVSLRVLVTSTLSCMPQVNCFSLCSEAEIVESGCLPATCRTPGEAPPTASVGRSHGPPLPTPSSRDLQTPISASSYSRLA